MCVYLLQRPCNQYINVGQGTRLQVLAQADNLGEGVPSFEEQHINLRRGDIIGK